MSATATTEPRSAPDRDRHHRAPMVEVVVPVYNEARTLETSVRRLHDFLATELPFTWRIVIADNASVDRTWAIAERLQRELAHVDAVHLDARAAAGRCVPFGRRAGLRSSATWTSTCRPTCVRCCR